MPSKSPAEGLRLPISSVNTRYTFFSADYIPNWFLWYTSWTKTNDMWLICSVEKVLYYMVSLGNNKGATFYKL